MMSAQPPSLTILVVEDDPAIARLLIAVLQMEGYQVLGPFDNGAEALSEFRSNPVDVALMDVNIRGSLDGIETAARLREHRPVPLIYLTSQSDRDTLERAKGTFPAAYLFKPFTPESVRISIELAFQNFSLGTHSVPTTPEPTESAQPGRETILRVNDSLFVRQNSQFMKVPLSDILFVEAGDNYITLQTFKHKFALRMPLTAALERIRHDRIVRVHRSYAVNIANLDSFSDTEVVMGKHFIPIGKNYKSDFLRQFDHL
jgi:DNA-binding LytR/AlgR family response regulator